MHIQCSACTVYISYINVEINRYIVPVTSGTRYNVPVISYSLLNLLCVCVCVFVCVFVTEYDHSGVLYTVEQEYIHRRSTCSPCYSICIQIVPSASSVQLVPGVHSLQYNPQSGRGFSNIPRSIVLRG
jgi:hypothetical protein